MKELRRIKFKEHFLLLSSEYFVFRLVSKNVEIET
jgi:hypothetical protein